MRADRRRAPPSAPNAVEHRAPRARRAPLRRLSFTVLAGVSLGACFDSKRIIFTGAFPGEDAGIAAGPQQGAVGAAPPADPLEPPGNSPVAPQESGQATLDPPLAEMMNPTQPGAASPPDAGFPPAPAPVLGACPLPVAAAPGAVLFSGALVGGACQASLDAPFATSWFSYQDSGDALVASGVAPGCAPDTCALHVEGPPAGAVGYSNYGAGLALPVSPPDVPLDVSGFSGFQFWARGSIVGTRGAGSVSAPQTLFAKIVTSTTRNGDDFGLYCTIDPIEWTLCRGEFATLIRDGFSTPDPVTDVLDVQSTLRLEFEFRLFRDAVGVVPVPVSLAIDLAAISLF